MIRAAVPMWPQSLYRAAVAAGTGPASASYDVDAATMHMERHERGIHALRSGTTGEGVTQVRSAVRRSRRWDASRPRSAQADEGYVARGAAGTSGVFRAAPVWERVTKWLS